MADNSLKKGRYTKYSNKIGLFSNSKGSFIKNDTEVVLNFPFKDTVLEAGMTKEDKGCEERFLQIDIDSKDIDTLEEPKVLTDFRYVDKDGERSLTASSDISFFDEDGELKQNLLIKGNNLLALHTLKSRLAGKVKLVYIDPPYNTGSDSFRYNDKFNHSSWLVFMKNRIEAVSELLRDDGVIFVQCDDNEQAYLKIMMDEIFGRENFLSTIVVEMSKTQGMKVGAAKNGKIVKNKEYLIVFAKNAELFSQSVQSPLYEYVDNYDSHYSYYLSDSGMTSLMDFLKNESGLRDEVNKLSAIKPFNIDNLGFFMKHSSIINDFIISNAKYIYRDNNANISIPSEVKEKITGRSPVEFVTEGQTYLLIKVGSGKIVQLQSLDRTLHYTDDFYPQYGRSVIRGDLWKGFALDMMNINREGSLVFQNGKKPERIIKDILKYATKEDDIFLDFCLGSGTSAAVAHKMKRRWIGIEQMDYVNSLAQPRLTRVIQGDQTGVSRAVGWQGGGSFVYFELKKYNQEYIDRIMEATSLKELEDIYVEMRNNAFLKFWFDRSHFEKDEDFRQLDLDGRKEALADVLDENQLYLNYADMGDTRHKVTADEKVLTDKFYGTNEN